MRPFILCPVAHSPVLDGIIYMFSLLGRSLPRGNRLPHGGYENYRDGLTSDENSWAMFDSELNGTWFSPTLAL